MGHATKQGVGLCKTGCAGVREEVCSGQKDTRHLVMASAHKDLGWRRQGRTRCCCCAGM